jgi:hypothetical protein
MKILGIENNNIECFIKTLEADPEHSIAWLYVGSLLVGQKTVSVNGEN